MIFFGKRGIEHVYKTASCCSTVKFLIGTGYLLGISGEDIYTVDLENGRLNTSRVESKVTAVDAPIDCRWAFLGLASGDIITFDAVNQAVGNYRVGFPSIDLQDSSSDPKPSPVSHLALNLLNPSLLLASYATHGVTVLYEVVPRRLFN